MLERGQSLKTTSELLGHFTVKTTGYIYSHVLDDVKRKANASLDDALLGDNSKENVQHYAP